MAYYPLGGNLNIWTDELARYAKLGYYVLVGGRQTGVHGWFVNTKPTQQENKAGTQSESLPSLSVAE